MKPLFPDAKQAASTQVAVRETPAVDLAAESAFAPPVVAPAHPLAPAESASAAVPVTDEQIDHLGETARNALSDVSKRLLEGVRAVDADAFGADLNRVVLLAKGLDPEQGTGSGLLGRVRGFLSGTKEKLLAQFNSVEAQMDALVVGLDRHAALHRRRVGDLEQLYVENYDRHVQLERAADHDGARMLAELRRFQEAQAAVAARDSFGAQTLADVQRRIDRLEKRIDDLHRMMLLAKQLAPQIRLMQDNARALVEKLDGVKTLTLPAWKHNFSLYLLQLEQTRSAAVADAVDDATDEALRRGADLLRQNSDAIARSRQRSVVSIETLKHCQQQLIGSVDDVQKINEEARARRREAEPKLIEMERELVARFAPGKR